MIHDQSYLPSRHRPLKKVQTRTKKNRKVPPYRINVHHSHFTSDLRSTIPTKHVDKLVLRLDKTTQYWRLFLGVNSQVIRFTGIKKQTPVFRNIRVPANHQGEKYKSPCELQKKENMR